MAGIKREPGEDINHFFNRLPKGMGEAIGNAGGGEMLARDLIRRQYYKEPDGISEGRPFSYADAVEKTCSILKAFYTCKEYPDAWLFSDEWDLGGGEVAVMIEKSTGAAFYPEAYFAAHPALDPSTPLTEFRVE